MHDRIPWRMRQLIRRSRYVMTAHAEEEMNDDDLGILDVERAILCGALRERQTDLETGGSK